MTQAEFDAIESSLVQAFADRKGAKSITFADQSVTFDTWDEARKFLNDLRAQVRASAGTSTTRYGATCKGV
jgi:hypothetical protein